VRTLIKRNTLIILVIKKLYGGLRHKTVTYNPSSPISIIYHSYKYAHEGLMKTISVESVYSSLRTNSLLLAEYLRNFCNYCSRSILSVTNNIDDLIICELRVYIYIYNIYMLGKDCKKTHATCSFERPSWDSIHPITKTQTIWLICLNIRLVKA